MRIVKKAILHCLKSNELKFKDTKSNVSLKEFNTFGIEVFAKDFFVFETVDQLREILKQYQNKQILILGGGSNLLFTDSFDGLVLKNEIKGIEIVDEDHKSVVIKVGAGENWHEFVLHCINNGWAGIENLSLIPGTVGAAPMQNIGAYGLELKDVFEKLEAYRIEDGKIVEFSNPECEFGYRTSIFKTHQKGKYIICEVYFRLSKFPQINISYGAIADTLKERGISNPGIEDVSNAVIYIRQSKLPDPVKIGNAGSFFKNPVITSELMSKLSSEFPEIPSYPAEEQSFKIPAAWLIEKAGWKGFRKGDVGVHEKQALVLVNYGNANGVEIYNLATDIKMDVHSKFGIDLEFEVNII